MHAIFLCISFTILLTPFFAHAVTSVSPVIPTEDNRSINIAARSNEQQRKFALVIGNSSYISSPLKNPANDARVISSVLRKLGFSVDERINAEYIQFNEAIESFGNKLKTGDVGLFFYAGHGIQVNGSNYLIPVDARIYSENEVRYKAIDTGLLLAKMEQSRNSVNMVILDACRDNPFNRSFRSANRGLASIDAPAGTIIAYSTAPGKTASDGDGDNSLYTSELIKILEIPGLKVEDVFKLVLRSVKEKSASMQIPWVSSSFDGEFIFMSPTATSDGHFVTAPHEKIKKPAQPATIQAKQSAETAVSFNNNDPLYDVEFTPVPAGCFHMGSNDFNNEKPVHEVCLDGFSIGKYEVTQALWQRIMSSSPSKFRQCGNDCPVEQISWNEAQEFFRRINALNKKNCRLPTEAEWEYAAKSGGRKEPFSRGASLDSLAWFEDNSDGKTHTVGQKQPNGIGIYDMSGNVWEWVQDWYGEKYYGESPRNNPKGPSAGKYRVLRGGSWSYSSANARAETRFRNDPDIKNPNFGFRMVCN